MIDIGESITINNEEKKDVNHFITFFSGAVAGAISRTVTAPLDRLKVVMQANTTGKLSLKSGVKEIYREGGTRGFFRGNGTNIIKIAPETACKFIMYDKIKAAVCKRPEAPSTTEKLVSGGLAGFSS
jgi:solute carrier family 25 phosphate transporter 23/24/25/41